MGEKRYLPYITIMSAISRDQCYFHFKLSMSAAAIDRNDCYPDKDRYVNECRVLKLKLSLLHAVALLSAHFTKTPISCRSSIIEVLFDILDIQTRFFVIRKSYKFQHIKYLMF